MSKKIYIVVVIIILCIMGYNNASADTKPVDEITVALDQGVSFYKRFSYTYDPAEEDGMIQFRMEWNAYDNETEKIIPRNVVLFQSTKTARHESWETFIDVISFGLYVTDEEETAFYESLKNKYGVPKKLLKLMNDDIRNEIMDTISEYREEIMNRCNTKDEAFKEMGHIASAILISHKVKIQNEKELDKKIDKIINK